MTFRKLDNAALNRPSAEEYQSARKLGLILVLDNVRSLNNVGSIFRTADAFGISEIILCGFTPCPPHREIQKTALGATDTVKWHYASSAERAVASLIEQKIKVLAVEQTENSTLLQDFMAEADQPYAMVLGNEMEGVQQSVIDLCHGTIEVPQVGTKHSLNVAVCAGVVCWSYFMQQIKSPSKA